MLFCFVSFGVLKSDKIKMAKTTSNQQYEKLVSLLVERPDIAQGFTSKGKENVKSFWDICAKELNALGPPIKDGHTWRKVWTDYKSYVKKKLVHNKKEVNCTGGGQNKMHYFSSLEEDVIRITGMQRNVEGIEESFCFGKQSEQVVEPQNKIPRLTESSESNDDPIANASAPEDISFVPSVSQPKRAKTTESDKNPLINLIKTQIEVQQTFLPKITEGIEHFGRTLTDLNDNVREISRGIDRLCNLGMAQLTENKRHNLEMERLWQQLKD